MNYEIKELKTKRLVIKKGEEKDYLKVFEYDFDKLKNIEGICKLVKQDTNKLLKLFKNGITNYFINLKKAHMFDWIIYLNKKPIGNILAFDKDKNNIEVSFNIHPTYWGNSYIKEALTKVIEYLYTQGFNSVICTYLDGNKKAKRVLDKMGFLPYKINKDKIKTKYGNLIDEYQSIMTKEHYFSKTGRLF